MGAPVPNNDAEFLATLWTHRSAIETFCRRLVGCSERGRELAQDTYIVALRRRETWEGRGTLRAWLHGIALNLCRNERRRASRQREEPLMADVPAEDPGGWEQTLMVERIEQLGVALERLSAEERFVLRCRYWDGLQDEAIASGAGWERKRVRALLQNARRHLRRRLSRRLS